MKHNHAPAICKTFDCRSLTGAWIETAFEVVELIWFSGRSLTGAWIETLVQCSPRLGFGCRSLTGAWIETGSDIAIKAALSSLPHGGVD